MTAPVEQGAQLVLRLQSLTAPRLVPLDTCPPAALDAWAEQVRSTTEAMVLLDAHGRVAALSLATGAMLGIDPADSVGVLLADLVLLVDFTAQAVPLEDPARHTPPLRSLHSGRLSRALIRLRLPAGTVATYDVVGVPLARGIGALGFFSEV